MTDSDDLSISKQTSEGLRPRSANLNEFHANNAIGKGDSFVEQSLSGFPPRFALIRRNFDALHCPPFRQRQTPPSCVNYQTMKHVHTFFSVSPQLALGRITSARVSVLLEHQSSAISLRRFSLPSPPLT